MRLTTVVHACAAAALAAAPAPLAARQADRPAPPDPYVAAVDLSGAHSFWRVHDVLAADREPAPDEWDALFGTPGYALLEERERRREALELAFRLAYRPSLAAEREAALARGGWVAHVLPHLARVPAQRAALADLERDLALGTLSRDATLLAREWLPAGATDGVPPPPVSFLYFMDARGYPERLLLDVLFFRELTNAVEVLGHELHHYYRAHIAPPRRPFGEDWVAWTLMTTENEGIAGLIDKRDVPGLSAPELERRYPDERARRYYREYQDHYRRSDEWLAWTDSLLVRVDAEPDSAAALALRFHREIPDNGRIMGAYMAEVIVAALGKDALIAVVGRPFAFWARYNDAARRAGAYVLSDAAMAVIARRDRTYAQ